MRWIFLESFDQIFFLLPQFFYLLFQTYIFFQNLHIFFLQIFHGTLLSESTSLSGHSIPDFLNQIFLFLFTHILDIESIKFFLNIVVVVKIIFFISSLFFSLIFYYTTIIILIIFWRICILIINYYSILIGTINLREMNTIKRLVHWVMKGLGVLFELRLRRCFDKFEKLSHYKFF